MRSVAPLLILLSLMASAGTAQVISVTEVDEDGNRHELGARRAGIVDINSRLLLALDGDSLRIATGFLVRNPEQIAAALDLVATLQDLSEQGMALLPAARDAVDSWAEAPADRAAMQALQDAVLPLGDLTGAILQLVPDTSSLMQRIDSAIGTTFGVLEGTQVAFAVLADEAERLRNDVDGLLRASGVYVQLGAWLVTGLERRPIHLPGFDDYPEGEFFEVERWNFTLTEAQRNQLDSLTVQARMLRDLSFEQILQLRPAVNTGVAGTASEASRCVTGVKAAFESVTQQVPAELAATITQGSEVIDSYIAFLTRLAARYGPAGSGAMQDPAAYLAQTTADVEELIRRTGEVRLSVNTLVALLATQSQGVVQQVESAVGGCSDVWDAISGGGTGSIGALLGLLGSSQRIDVASLEFGEEVRRLDISSVPASSEFSLKRTGRRRAGDRIVVRLSAGNDVRSRADLEDREFRMFRVQTHVNMIVGLIFAAPKQGVLTGDSRFQPGPSYSMLLSWGSRASAIRNQLFRFSLGLNIAALDFNKDDNYELGIGAVASSLSDFVQIGGGYNIARDEFYWFFGLRLPAPTMTLPGVGSEAAGGP